VHRRRVERGEAVAEIDAALALELDGIEEQLGDIAHARLLDAEVFEHGALDDAVLMDAE
jgi:hypothetical protein